MVSIEYYLGNTVQADSVSLKLTEFYFSATGFFFIFILFIYFIFFLLLLFRVFSVAPAMFIPGRTRHVSGPDY